MDSAAGTVRQGRNPETQGLFPLKGKPVNTLGLNNKQLLDNDEIRALISVLGCGINENFDIEKLRYGKVIILSDADTDGLHIQCLLLTFFLYHMPQLIQEGKVFIGKPPLYSVTEKGKKTFFLNEVEYGNFLAERTKEKLSDLELTHLVNALDYTQNLLDQHYLTNVISYYTSINFEEKVEKISKDFSCSPQAISLILETGVDSSWAQAKFPEITTIYEDGSYYLHGIADGVFNNIYVNTETYNSLKNLINIEPGYILMRGDKIVTIYELLKEINKVVTSRLFKQRYKGLGETNAKDLAYTALDPVSRGITKVSINDAKSADEWMNILMGKDTEPRKQFIQTIQNSSISENDLDLR